MKSIQAVVLLQLAIVGIGISIAGTERSGLLIAAVSLTGIIENTLHADTFVARFANAWLTTASGADVGAIACWQKLLTVCLNFFFFARKQCEC